MVVRCIPSALWILSSRVSRFVCALRWESRSFVGRMKTLSAKRWWRGVDLGPAWERLPGGRLIPDARTNARSYGIQVLALSRPWASSIDREMFLAGFDVGEQYALNTLDRRECNNSCEHPKKVATQAATPRLQCPPPSQASRAKIDGLGKNYSGQNARHKPLSGSSASLKKRSSNG